MTAVLSAVRRSWLRPGLGLWLRLRERRRAPVRGLALAGFCLVIAAIVGFTVVVFDAGRGGVLVACLVGLFTLAAVLRPEGVAATVVLLLIAGAYLYGTTLAGVRPGLLPVLGLTVALYVAHALVALAAAVPPGATVESAVLRRWLRRVAEVLAVAVPVGLLVSLLQQQDAPELVRTLGYAVAVGLVAVAVACARGRAPWDD